ncbi:MAG: restriction endonuclease subunit M, partial [Anaerolineaceae bacterium 4572_5.2]
MRLFEVLEKQLKNEPNYVTDNGELKKWVVINKAQNFDVELIELLLNNKEIKDNFFVDIKGTLVFKQSAFVQFLEQKNYLNDSYTQYKNKKITQLLEPKVLSNAKSYATEGEQDFTGFTRNAELNKKRGLPKNTISDNLIIKGNNLLVLHSLKKRFSGKVK